MARIVPEVDMQLTKGNIPDEARYIMSFGCPPPSRSFAIYELGGIFMVAERVFATGAPRDSKDFTLSENKVTVGLASVLKHASSVVLKANDGGIKTGTIDYKGVTLNDF